MLSFIQPSLEHLPCSRPVSRGWEAKASRPGLSLEEPRVTGQSYPQHWLWGTVRQITGADEKRD